MPYVRQVLRPNLDRVVELMNEVGVEVNGDLNYILFAFCKRHIKPSYHNYKNYRGELRETADWIGEIFLKPCEYKKAEENGDVE